MSFSKVSQLIKENPQENSEDFDVFDDLDSALDGIIDPDAGVSEFEVTESTEDSGCESGSCKI
jgi:hypothetical protein